LVFHENKVGAACYDVLADSLSLSLAVGSESDTCMTALNPCGGDELELLEVLECGLKVEACGVSVEMVDHAKQRREHCCSTPPPHKKEEKAEHRHPRCHHHGPHPHGPLPPPNEPHHGPHDKERDEEVRVIVCDVMRSVQLR
jgi:hypothetical protein